MIMMTEETSSFLHGSQCAIVFARGWRAELRTLIKHKKTILLRVKNYFYHDAKIR